MVGRDKSQFHDDEYQVQTRLGVAEQVAQYGEDFIRQAMPEQHQKFFNELPMAILGVPDIDGYPWPVPVFGQPGFISANSEFELSVNGLPETRSLLNLQFESNQKVGLLGIQLETRRRNRMNGTLSAISKDSFSIEVDQSFGNCPQYIQSRSLRWKTPRFETPDLHDEMLSSSLSIREKALLQSANTFFIASRTHQFSADKRSGIDASHRGGKPGFVKVDGQRLLFPDFSGNRFFNTLGNIESDSRVGLFFPDFATSDAVFIKGRAKIIWDGELVESFAGAERIVQVEVEQSVFISSYLPLVGEVLDYSPSLKTTGTWQQVKEKQGDGFSLFTVTKKIKESDVVCSFYFSPTQRAKVKTYHPGQFISLKLPTGEGEATEVRSYTLSQASDGVEYRISVKREVGGKVSNYLHDEIEVGDRVLLSQPNGQFYWQHERTRPVVMLSNGVGITPMIAMLETFAERARQGMFVPQVWFFHGSKSAKTLPFIGFIQRLSERSPWLHVVVCYSKEVSNGEQSKVATHAGRLSIETIKSYLPFQRYDFYLCGSEGFMRGFYAALQDLGVNKTDIYYEFFGQGSIEAPERSVNEVEQAKVVFTNSGKEALWEVGSGTLLELAEAHSLSPNYSCRSGHCGACAIKCPKGKVTYPQRPSAEIEQDEILLCCAQPAVQGELIEIEL